MPWLRSICGVSSDRDRIYADIEVAASETGHLVNQFPILNKARASFVPLQSRSADVVQIFDSLPENTVKNMNPALEKLLQLKKARFVSV
jgi:hypothetical protein